MNNTTALVTTSPDISSADIFFDRKNVVTDWDGIKVMVEDGTYKKEDALRWLKEMEPLEEHDHRDHQHWVNQQILRLCLLKEAGKPFDSKHTCDCCGKRKGDILFGEDGQYYHYCLPCKEEAEQTYNGGGRGSCEFILPRYNHMNHSWGLLYYWSHSDNTFIFWLADFYKTSAKGKTIKRTVVRRNGNDVYYRSGDSQKELNCWITTWWDWSRTADEPKP